MSAEMDEKFRPILEGNLFPDNGHPIFAKVLTHKERLVHIGPRFLESPNYVRTAGRMIAEHHRRYVKTPSAERFPIAYYALFTAPDRTIRYNVAGEVIGVFEDIPCNPSFEVGGRSFEIQS